jgi:HEPN domain-containing protein
MRAEHRDSTDPVAWLRRARSNLLKAEAARNVPDVFFEDLCFDAQQAAEKAIKALLLHRRKAFPKTHVIGELLTLVRESGLEVSEEIREAALLTRYAVVTRYPGPAEVTEEEYTRAVELAERVLRWAESLIAG